MLGKKILNNNNLKIINKSIPKKLIIPSETTQLI